MIEVICSAAVVSIRVLEFTKVVKCGNLFQSKQVICSSNNLECKAI